VPAQQVQEHGEGLRLERDQISGAAVAGAAAQGELLLVELVVPEAVEHRWEIIRRRCRERAIGIGTPAR
jgi:hypothetical protein